MAGLDTVAVPWTFYVLVCLDCGPGDSGLVLFRSPAERGAWAAEHTRLAGHQHWRVLDHTERPA